MARKGGKSAGVMRTGTASTGGGGFSVVGGDEIHAFATRLKGAEKPLRLAVNKSLREIAKPLGEDMLRGGADAMPRSGGLSARVRNSGVTMGTLRGGSGASARIEIRLKSREGYDLTALDRGQLRHPVFGRGPWVSQSVPSGKFMEPFNEAAPKVRDELATEIAKALDQIAGD